METDFILSLREKILQPQIITFEYLIDFAEHYKKEMESGKVLTTKKRKFSEETIRTYSTTISHLKNFETLLNLKIRLTEITPRFFQSFEMYLVEKKYTLNTISLILSKLKAICSVAIDREIAFISTKNVKTPRDKTTKVYLNINEIKQLRNAEVSKQEERYLDAFIIGCFTGLRFSQLNLFIQNPTHYVKEYNGNSYIDIVSEKTNEQSIIPLGETVIGIFKKYNGKMGKLYLSDYNEIIKNIAERSGITNMVVVRKTIGSEVVEELKPKYKEISSHTGRRTFVTMIKPLLDDEVIMGITGHKNKDTLNQYNRSAILDRVSPALGHEFFNQII